MASGELIANMVAALILAGMMFLPFVNILVGGVVGGGVGGFGGFFGGALLALLLTAVEVWLLRRAPMSAAESEMRTQPQPAARHFTRAIVNLGDWRQLKRGFAKSRIAWAGAYRRAA
jgi:hypothetical protein